MLWWTLRQLKSKNWKTRDRATEKIEKRIKKKVARAVKPLVVALKDKGGYVDMHEEMARTLVRIWDVVVEPLVASLKDEEWLVRKAAAVALGEIKGARAVEPLVALLKDEEWLVRKAAAVALGNIKDARAVMPLVEALKDEDKGVRCAAAYALTALGWQPGNAGERALHAVAAGKYDAAVAEGVAAVEPLVAALKDEDYDVREAAEKALGNIKDAQAVEPIAEALKDKDYYVRKAAAEALGKIGDARAVEPIAEALKDKDYYEVRRAAAEALGNIKDARAVGSLVAALKDKDWDVRKAAAEALGKIKDAMAVEPLVATLKDKDYYYCGGPAAWALGEIGDARAVEPLVEALWESRVREAAADALVKIGDAARAVGPLVAVLKGLDLEDMREVVWGEAEQLCITLHRLLRVSAPSITTTDLYALAALNDVVKVGYIERLVRHIDWDYGAGSASDEVTTEEITKTISFSYVRQLAEQELIRRGL